MTKPLKRHIPIEQQAKAELGTKARKPKSASQIVIRRKIRMEEF